MRVPPPFLAALASSLLTLTAGADPAAQLVVQTRATPPSALAARSVHERIGAALASRLDSLGLEPLRSLADALPPAPARRPSRARSVLAHPFDLDPARVWLLQARDSIAARDAARVLARDPAIEWVEPNRTRAPAVFAWRDARRSGRSAAGDSARAGASGFPSDPLFQDGRQWGLDNRGPSGAIGGIAGADIRALEAWRRSTGGAHVRLAIADTGIDPRHPELETLLPDGGPRIERGVNVTADPSTSFADSFGHGTPVAGVMAARTGEGAHFDSLGIAGVCGGDGAGNPGCRLIPIKITSGHAGWATSFDIAGAIVYATDAGARAMNLSFAGSGPSRLERTALYYAITRGCVVVAASGNRGDTQPLLPQYPAAYAAEGLCVQVGASDPFDRRAGFSSYGPGLDLLAPGLDIWTTFMTYPSAMGVARDGYVVGSGTSFAAPFVTGTIGLLAAARPELADADFQHLLRESARDLGPAGPDVETGWGRLDAAAALRAIDPTVGILHDEVAARRLRVDGSDTLRVGEPGPGAMERRWTWNVAHRIEASATVALPDSFLDPVRVWPRVAGTMSVRGDFELPYFAPWAEVVAIGPDAFTLRGYLYQVEDTEDGDGGPLDVPLPRDQARFGYTVIGRVDRPPSLELLAPAAGLRVAGGDSVEVRWKASDPDEVSAIEIWLEGPGTRPLPLLRVPGSTSGAMAHLPCPAPFAGEGTLRVVALDEHGRRRDRTAVPLPLRLAPGSCDSTTAGSEPRATPNPFRDRTRLIVPQGGAVTVVDVSGRVVRRARVDGSVGEFVWDGRDHAGRALGPGLYFVRCDGARGRTQAKVLKLE